MTLPSRCSPQRSSVSWCICSTRCEPDTTARLARASRREFSDGEVLLAAVLAARRPAASEAHPLPESSRSHEAQAAAQWDDLAAFHGGEEWSEPRDDGIRLRAVVEREHEIISARRGRREPGPQVILIGPARDVDRERQRMRRRVEGDLRRLLVAIRPKP